MDVHRKPILVEDAGCGQSSGCNYKLTISTSNMKVIIAITTKMSAYSRPIIIWLFFDVQKLAETTTLNNFLGGMSKLFLEKLTSL